MNAVATHANDIPDFLRVAGAILTLQAGFWFVIIASVAVVGWILWFLRPILIMIGYGFVWFTKIMAVAIIIGLVFAAFGHPDMILDTIFYSAYYFSKGIGAIIGPIIGV